MCEKVKRTSTISVGEGTSCVEKKHKATHVTQMTPLSKDAIKHSLEQVKKKTKEALGKVNKMKREALGKCNKGNNAHWSY